MSISKNKIIKIFQYILALLLILSTNSMYSYIRGFETLNTVYLLGFPAIVGCIILIHRNIELKHVTRFVLCSFGLCMYIFVYLILQPNGSKSTIQLLFIFIILLMYFILFENKGSFPNVLIYYKNLMVLIGLISFVLWVLGPLSEVISPSHIYTSWSSTGDYVKCDSYYYLLFSPQISGEDDILSFFPTRFTSIFTEAPMCSFNFCLAFLIESLFEKKKSVFKKIILLITIVASLSTTGYCFIVMYYMLKLFFYKNDSRFIKVIKPVIFIFFAIGSVIIIIVLVNSKADTSSGSIRLDDFIACFKTFCSYPVLGCGIGQSGKIQSFMATWRGKNTGLSTGFLQLLAQGGIYIFLLYLLAIISSLYKAIIYRDVNRFIFTILVSFMLLLTVVEYKTIVMLILMFFAFDMKQKKSSYSILINRGKNAKTKILKT